MTENLSVIFICPCAYPVPKPVRRACYEYSGNGSALQRGDLRGRWTAAWLCIGCGDRTAGGAGAGHFSARPLSIFRADRPSGGLYHPLELHPAHRPGHHFGRYPPGRLLSPPSQAPLVAILRKFRNNSKFFWKKYLQNKTQSSIIAQHGQKGP